jgi:hypothetical protein
MRKFALAALLATTPASAADITCIASSAEADINNQGAQPQALPGPENFSITPAGLKTSWGGSCASMKGEITADAVAVSCEGDNPGLGGAPGAHVKIAIRIDRHLGTYTEDWEITEPDGTEGKSFYGGICQKREGF